MQRIQPTIGQGTRARCLGILFALAALSACDDRPMPAAPSMPSAPALGVNNGANNRRILFARDGSIFAMNADGTGVTQLTVPDLASSISDRSPAWSPDGKRVAFVRCGLSSDDCDIYVMNADGTGIARLTAQAGANVDPTFSKDGKRIAFASSRDANGSVVGADALDIYIMDSVTGGNVVRVTNQPGMDLQPTWSPDGKQIAFVSARDGGDSGMLDLYAVTLDGLQVTRLTWASEPVTQPSWAPGGKQIAFTVGFAEGPNTDIYVLTLDSKQLTRLTDGPDTPGVDEAATWSPDGKQIAFISTRSGTNRDAYVMNADGKAVTRLTYTASDEWDPAWNR
jgi:Tol biopolymer transport system component